MPNAGKPADADTSFTNEGSDHDKLLKAIREDDSERFARLLNEIKAAGGADWKASSSSTKGSKLLEYACRHGKLFAVKSLIDDAGVDPNGMSDKYSGPPLVEAAAEAQIDVMSHLINRGNIDLNVPGALRLTALHKVTQKLIFYSRNAEKRPRYLACLRLLLSAKKPINVNAQDTFENTPLHFTTFAGDEEATLELLRHGAHLGLENSLFETPLERMSPSTLESYFDSCISLKKNKNNEEQHIKFNYSVLAPPRHNTATMPSAEKANPEYDVTWHLSASEKHQHLLRHPLITSFLALKWPKIWTFYLINLIFYTIALGVITTFLLLLHSGYKMDEVLLGVFWALTIVCVILLYFRELFHFLVAPFWAYALNPENLAVLTMLVCTTLVLFNSADAASVRHFSAVAVLLAWIEELLLLGRLPKFAIFVTTFKIVLLNFAYLLLLHSFLFVGFGLSFFFVFAKEQTGNATSEEKPAFSNIHDSFIKVLPMMIGEFDFNNLPLDPNPYTSRLIFIAFVFLITIVLLNVLNGFAVSDTEKIQRKAEILWHVSQVALISYVESILLGDPFDFLAKWVPFPWLRRNCYRGFCSVLRSTIGTLLNNHKQAKSRAMLFDNCLPNKTLTVFLSDNYKVSSNASTDSTKAEMCKCHKKFRLDENLINSAIKRAKVEKKEEKEEGREEKKKEPISYQQGIQMKMKEFESKIDSILKLIKEKNT